MASSVPEVPAMDEFAQTRGADDLFDDEIVPVSAEEEAQQSHSDPEVSQPVDKPGIDTQSAPNDTAQPRGDGRSKAKSRGRPVSQRGGRADRDAGNKTAENYEQFKVIEYNDNCPPVPKPQDDTKLAKSTSNEAANQRVPAVRGDRSATGGVRKPKLTGEELDKRIASARENAAKVAAAHARAQADLLSFLDREKEEAEKRRVETANRRAMDSERAQNRQRKLKAVTGREWDATKQEEDYAPRGRGYRRGMHGAVTGHTHRDFEAKHHEGPARNQGGTRGRKGKGGRRGSSRGSASTSDRASGEAAAEPAPPAAPAMTSETDFPSLGEMKNTLPEDGESKSPVGGSWADQVEAQ